MPSILIVDCFDSFTYNLQHYLDELNKGFVDVIRYDKFNPENISSYSHVVLSPGPGLPDDYPKIFDYLKLRPQNQSVLGVCLGHQCLGVFFGSSIKQLDTVKHGQLMEITQTTPSVLFSGLKSPMETGHYHSWVLDIEGFPFQEFEITAQSSSGLIMSIEHKAQPLFGVQFHPESVMTPSGKMLLRNWLVKDIS